LWRKVLVVLFLPVAVGVFMVGWILYCFGQPRNKSGVKTRQGETLVTEDGAADEGLEVKIIEDLMEKVLEIE
jgi:hypothetical protein